MSLRFGELSLNATFGAAWVKKGRQGTTNCGRSSNAHASSHGQQRPEGSHKALTCGKRWLETAKRGP
eukprot:5116918-Alexandrium_andersonii.AAC.1